MSEYATTEENARLMSHPSAVQYGDMTKCHYCGQSWDTNDSLPPWCKRPHGFHKPGGFTPMEPPPDSTGLVIVFAVLGAVLAVFIVVLIWASQSKATEYSMISKENLAYCNEYARAEARDMPGMTRAYGDCIRVLPARLPVSGTVPATGETWAEACDREYRTWDAATGTVVRRGSPDRVECPMVLRDGEWIVPAD